MKLRMAVLAIAALVSSGCEHPFANAGLQGAPRAEPVAVFNADAEDVVLARATLQALLLRHAGAPIKIGVDLRGARADPAVSLAPASWLETQSATLRALAERSQAARRSPGDVPARR